VIKEMLTLCPDFESRDRSLVRRMVFLDERVETLLEGSAQGGVAVGGVE
jgi:hypothetical protein